MEHGRRNAVPATVTAIQRGDVVAQVAVDRAGTRDRMASVMTVDPLEACCSCSRSGGPVIPPSSGWPRVAPPAHRTRCVHPMDWFDLPEDTHPSWAADESRMRLYIAVGLIGIAALGLLGGMLHILPA